MVPKYSLTLDNEFIKYCEINNIENPETFAKQVFQRGFTIIKYGETPKGFQSNERIIEKEVIKEVPVEVIVEKIVTKEIPVEVIKEIIKEVPVEVIKEVPIEIKGDTQIVVKEIIKEVPVEKIIEVTKEVTNNDEVLRLTEENSKLQEELNKLTASLENFGKKAKFMKDSNLSSLYDE
jgi:signal recognition particle GTPase